MKQPSLDTLIRKQEVGALRPSAAAKQYTGSDNRRSGFYTACWLRHLQLVAEKRYRKAQR
jgi:hypothetical protein